MGDVSAVARKEDSKVTLSSFHDVDNWASPLGGLGDRAEDTAGAAQWRGEGWKVGFYSPSPLLVEGCFGGQFPIIPEHTLLNLGRPWAQTDALSR